MSRLATLLAAALLAPAFAQPTAPPGPYPGQMLVRVAPRTHAELDTVFEHCVGVWSCHVGVGPIEVQVTPAQKAELEGLGLATQVLIADVQAEIDREAAQIAGAQAQAGLTWFETYRTLAEHHAKLDEWVLAYPGMVTTFSGGNTLEGRAIRGVRLSGPDQPGNPRSARPVLLFHGSQHAREWITPMTVMFTADQLLERYAADTRIRTILDRFEVLVIPVFNCDGYEHSWQPGNRLWRKNRRPNANGSFGVDNNRNWGHEWGGEGASTTPNSETYRGTGPFSEPENQALRDFMLAETRLIAYIDFHSYGQLVMSPWAYTAALPPDAPLLQRLDDTMAEGIFAVHGMHHDAGPIYTTIYPASGGAVDWVYGVRNSLAFTIEVRDNGEFGFLLPADQIIATGEENFEGVLRLAEFLLQPLYFSLPAGLPLMLDADATTPVRISVNNGRSTLAGPPTLFYRTGSGAFIAAPSTLVSGVTYEAPLPASACPQRVEYYFEAATTGGETLRYPEGISPPLGVLSVPGEGSPFPGFADDMETDRGWTVGVPSDAATPAGLWQRANPEATAAQPEDDHTPAPGTLCWITGPLAGGGVGANDVDGGTTTLTSPLFSAVPNRLLRIVETRLTYSRWYSNDQGSAPNSDSMPVLISNDNGANWVQLESVTENADAWVTRSFRLEGILAPTPNMRLRFQARDANPGSIVEAGVDDVRVEFIACTPDLDLNQDGNADQEDLVYLITVIAGGGNPTGIEPDFNLDGNVDQDDIADLITALAGG